MLPRSKDLIVRSLSPLGVLGVAALGVVALGVVGAALASPAFAASPEEENLLGCGCEQAQFQSYLPFTRSIGVSGTVKGSLRESAADSGVPAEAMLEVTKALATAIDLDRDLRDGDRFYVRYEQTFTTAGVAIETAHVRWAEIKTAAKGALALHRFRPAGARQDSLWLASGVGTAASDLDMPLKSIAITSGFGVRVDPIDQPWSRNVAMGPLGPSALATNRLQPAAASALALAPSPLLTSAGSMNTSVSVSAPYAGLAALRAQRTTSAYRGFSGGGGGVMAMHEGVDLVAAMGTPVYAAGDGIVVGARPNGRYGNWIDIEHAGPRLATVYGHLSAYAPGIAPGVEVKRGELIGFTGSTGRVTGPHLHFEIRVDGRPQNPIGNAALKHGQLRGADLVKFRKTVADDLAERDRETRAM
jgi:murein DD-endopeptidase MepM/ murein hydrolase activator NlpD